tara:strand:- start:422 stop:1051 length:630 start_codon:yes stop_codon:yes gene_type:complete
MASLVLTAETLVSTPSAGQKEFSGTIFTGAPTSTTRGIIPTEQFFRLNADLAGANATGAQNTFGVGVTLAASTVYEFEIMYILYKTVGATSHNISFGLAGTATLNNIGYNAIGTDNSGGLNARSASSGFAVVNSNTATSVQVSGAIAVAAAVSSIVVKGTVSINAGGTFIPQYTLSAAPGGAYSTIAGSYMKIKPIGVSGADTSVGTWA